MLNLSRGSVTSTPSRPRVRGGHIAALLSAVVLMGPGRVDASNMHDAFYGARYDEAAQAALTRTVDDPGDLDAYDVRSSARLFQLKAVLDHVSNKEQALRQCRECAVWLDECAAASASGLRVARARLEADPADETAKYFVGKLNLNYLWLQLGPLGKKTGWSVYWDARRALDAVLASNPHHVRARVARAWVEYIVGTRVPRGTRWILGGGNRRRALGAMREAAKSPADGYAAIEAKFALWEMLVREEQWGEAASIAQGLIGDFPENPSLLKFLEARGHAVNE